MMICRKPLTERASIVRRLRSTLAVEPVNF